MLSLLLFILFLVLITRQWDIPGLRFSSRWESILISTSAATVLLVSSRSTSLRMLSATNTHPSLFFRYKDSRLLFKNLRDCVYAKATAEPFAQCLANLAVTYATWVGQDAQKNLWRRLPLGPVPSCESNATILAFCRPGWGAENLSS
jgi:hypothetical protein